MNIEDSNSKHWGYNGPFDLHYMGSLASEDEGFTWIYLLYITFFHEQWLQVISEFQKKTLKTSTCTNNTRPYKDHVRLSHPQFSRHVHEKLANHTQKSDIWKLDTLR